MLARDEDLSELPGIGKDLADKITEIVETGRLGALEKLEKDVPAELSALMRLPGLGPKRVAALHEQLGIDTLADLEKAARAGDVRALDGFGEKTEKKLLDALVERRQVDNRTPLGEAEQIAEPLLDHLRNARGVERATIAGSYRRRRDTVGDIDIVVACENAPPVMDRFVAYGDVAEIVSKGDTRSTVRLRCGVQVDLRVVPPHSYGAALMYLTGSKAHNIAVRRLAVAKKLKINEYGVFRGSKRIAGRTEEELYAKVGLSYIEPELREDRGEIEAARNHRLPRLVTVEDLRGDLHAHTNATDGSDTLEAIVDAARARGYRYVAITDHTQRLTVAHGLDRKRLGKQVDAIERLNAKLERFTVLASAEVDILEDGSLDLPDDVLDKLDLTICAIHYKFDLTREKQTERVIRAMDNPHFNVFAHPTGRLLGEREPYAIDLERIMDAALERGCYLEVNAQPARLDLDDVHCKLAKERGLKVAISTDAHRAGDLEKMRFGVAQARRGWLEPADVLNTRSVSALRKLLKRT
jgi:DNA polymerase (family 10)